MIPVVCASPTLSSYFALFLKPALTAHSAPRFPARGFFYGRTSAFERDARRERDIELRPGAGRIRSMTGTRPRPAPSPTSRKHMRKPPTRKAGRKSDNMPLFG